MKEQKRRVQIFLIMFLVITILGTFGFMTLENLSLGEAFYYNIVTMSTVGYGDIHPTNPASRMFAILLIVMGGATFLGLIANVTELLILKRETQSRLKKVNMILGAFFSEVGYTLLEMFIPRDVQIEALRKSLLVRPNWKEQQFQTAEKAILDHRFSLHLSGPELQQMNQFLNEKRSFLIGLLENPVLIEHEGFTETLLPVFHLMDELNCRKDLTHLPESDLKHLMGDMNRAYKRLSLQWMKFLKHLKAQYPYLYSLAVRKNPFDPEADPEVSD